VLKTVLPIKSINKIHEPHNRLRLKACLCILFFLAVNSVAGQNDSLISAGYKKISRSERIFPGYKLFMKYPVGVNVPFVGQDDPLDDISQYKNNFGESSNYYFSGGAVLSLENKFGKGAGVGLELGYFPGKTFRLSFITELHFLAHFCIDMRDFKKKFTSGIGYGFFSKYAFSVMTSPDLSRLEKEYYLDFTLAEFHFLVLDIDMIMSSPVLRRKYDPVFADAGLFIRLEYNFRR
jgi:hypothetical protein